MSPWRERARDQHPGNMNLGTGSGLVGTNCGCPRRRSPTSPESTGRISVPWRLGSEIHLWKTSLASPWPSAWTPLTLYEVSRS